jgi:hypothetical protein
MPLAVYPGTLPYKPRVDGYSDDYAPQVERTDFDFGNSRQRNKRTGFLRTLAYVLRFTPAERVIFEAFLTTNLNGGADRFQMPVWLGEAWVDCEVQIQNAKVNWRRVGPRWAAAFTLEVVRILP